MLPLLALLCALPSSSVRAQQQKRTRAQQRTDIALELRNPLPDLVSIRSIGDVDLGLGDTNESLVLLRLVSLLPMRLTHDVNLVVWNVLPIHSNPPSNPGGERLNGVGDVLQHLLLSPARVGRTVWGVGPVGQLPTAFRSALGAGTLAIGPSVAAVYQGPAWTVSMQAWHLRTVTGAVGRPAIERTHLLPSVSYTFTNGLNLGLDSESFFDWRNAPGERATLPVQLTLGRVTEIGDQTLNLVLGGRYYVLAPKAGPVWGVRLAVAFTFRIARDDEE